MIRPVIRLFLLSVCLFAAAATRAEPGWVSDQIEVTLRTGPSTSNAITRMLPSGTQIVRPAKGSSTFLAWRDGQWTPVHREHGSGWMWST